MLKNSPMLLAGGVAVALLIGGCSKNDADNADTTAAAPPVRPAKPQAKATGVPGGGPTSGTPAKPGAPGGAKGAQVASTKPGAPGKPAGTGAKKPQQAAPAQAHPATPGAGKPGISPALGQPGAPGQPAGTPGMKIASIPRSHRDPFYIDWKKIPPPPYIFGDSSIMPLRVASADVEVPPPGDIAIREIANRRVAGIMSGDGVFAILEKSGDPDTEIVKPGSVTKDGYRVVAITSDNVKLQRKDGNVIRTQIVPLTDAGANQQAGGGSLFGNGMGAPGSGGPPGSGGFPGSGGPGGRRPGGRGGPIPGGGGGGPRSGD